jgi:hypothetical protein
MIAVRTNALPQAVQNFLLSVAITDLGMASDRGWLMMTRSVSGVDTGFDSMGAPQSIQNAASGGFSSPHLMQMAISSSSIRTILSRVAYLEFRRQVKR